MLIKCQNVPCNTHNVLMKDDCKCSSIFVTGVGKSVNEISTPHRVPGVKRYANMLENRLRRVFNAT